MLPSLLSCRIVSEPTIHMISESKCPHLSAEGHFLRLYRSKNVSLHCTSAVPVPHRHKALESRILFFLFSFSLNMYTQAAASQKEQE